MQVFRGWIAIAFCLATPSLAALGANRGGIAVTGGPLQPTPSAAQKENGRNTADVLREAGLIFASSPSSTPPSPWGGELGGQLLMSLGDDDTPEAVRLLESGAAVNGDLTGDGMTPLMLAQSPEMVTALLGRGADPNQRDGTGQTALHHLVFAQRAEQMLPLLVNVGAEVNAVARGCNGQTPLLAARQLFFEGGTRTTRSASCGCCNAWALRWTPRTPAATRC